MMEQTSLSVAETQENPRAATLYRMVMPEHMCPWGLKAKALLESRGYVVEDRWLTSRAEIEAFKAEHGVTSTPQAFVANRRIGGYEDLRRWLGIEVNDPDEASYTPVVAVFAASAALALGASQAAYGQVLTTMAIEWFIAFSMVVLAMLKLQDIERFSTMFLGYDLLARRWVPYSHIYPFAEFTAGALMAAHALDWLSIPLALFIGTIGAISVSYAVYVQKRELKCACVGGSSRVPLGFVSLTENLFMIGMALWMLAPHI